MRFIPKTLKVLIGTIVAALLALTLFVKPADAWGTTRDNSDVEVMRQLDKMVAQSNKVVGMPGITNFFEKRMVRQLYEMRDDPTYRTFSYITNMDGKFIKICDSIGYGINASIQFSNPMKPADITETVHRDFTGYQLDLMPQAEPNGLFMPEGLAATYVMCLDPRTLDKPMPDIYVEQEVIVSPWPLP
jgi:hypothetical protein